MVIKEANWWDIGRRREGQKNRWTHTGHLARRAPAPLPSVPARWCQDLETDWDQMCFWRRASLCVTWFSQRTHLGFMAALSCFARPLKHNSSEAWKHLRLGDDGNNAALAWMWRVSRSDSWSLSLKTKKKLLVGKINLCIHTAFSVVLQIKDTRI